MKILRGDVGIISLQSPTDVVFIVAGGGLTLSVSIII